MKFYYHYLPSTVPKRRSRTQRYLCRIVTFNRYLTKTIYRTGKFMVLHILDGGWSMWYARIWEDEYTNPQFDIGVQSKVIEIRSDTEEGNMEADTGEHASHMPRYQLLSLNFRFNQTGNLHTHLIIGPMAFKWIKDRRGCILFSADRQISRTNGQLLHPNSPVR